MHKWSFQKVAVGVSSLGSCYKKCTHPHLYTWGMYTIFTVTLFSHHFSLLSHVYSCFTHTHSTHWHFDCATYWCVEQRWSKWPLTEQPSSQIRAINPFYTLYQNYAHFAHTRIGITFFFNFIVFSTPPFVLLTLILLLTFVYELLFSSALLLSLGLFHVSMMPPTVCKMQLVCVCVWVSDSEVHVCSVYQQLNKSLKSGQLDWCGLATQTLT